jgi:hypothetical protein
MTQWGLDTLFNPAKRHMDEEKRRLQSTREEVGDSSGGKRIDLESGRVTIRKADSAESDEPAAEGADADEPDAVQTDDKTPTNNKKPAEKKSVDKKAKRELTPAGKRAAERRARLRD